MQTRLSATPAIPAGQRILEGIVTTLNEDGSTNIAPMGPLVDEPIEQLLLRPFATSTTWANLKRTRYGVLNVTDDVELLARAAVGQVLPPPPLIQLPEGKGNLLAQTCRWYAFMVKSVDERQQRVLVTAQVEQRGRLRDFFGFNRAKHAVVEAAILATRTHILPRKNIEDEFQGLEKIVQKTGGEQEFRAFRFLQEYIAEIPTPAPLKIPEP
jgi:hypothetical protein